MIQINNWIYIPENEVRFDAIRAQGAGGQNVNKVSTAIHMRFDIQKSSLPEEVKDKLLALADNRISKDGVIVIKAQQFRTQVKNRKDAINRLKNLILKAIIKHKKRKPTRLSHGAKQKRVDSKTKHGKLKQLRRRITPE